MLPMPIAVPDHGQPHHRIAGLHWSAAGEEVRSKLAQNGLTEADAEDGSVTVAAIADRIRGFHELAELTELMANQCQHILNSSLQLDDTFTSQICSSVSETLQTILISALHHRCPLIDTEGYACIASKQPVIYIPDSFAFESSLFLACSYLLLPSSRSVRVIPSSLAKRDGDNYFATYSLDCDELLRAIEEDKQAGRIPLCVFAALSTTVYRQSSDVLIYKNDCLSRIRQICDAHGIWLHVTGADLYFLSANPWPISVSKAVDAADSFAIRPRDLVTTGSDAHVLMIRSAQMKDKLKKPSAYETVGPVYIFLSGIAGELQPYTDAHLAATRLIMEDSRSDYSEYFRLESSSHSEIRPTCHVVPTCCDLNELGLTLQMANSFILQDINIQNLNCAAVYDSTFDGVQLTIRPYKYDEWGQNLSTETDVRDFLDVVKSRVKRLGRALPIRTCLSRLLTEKKPFVWSDRSTFSCQVGIGAFRLVPGFLTNDQQEAANCLNDCLAEQLFKKSPCFRGCISDDNLVSIAILTIPSGCEEDMTDDEIAEHIFEIIFKTQAEIQYPQAVIELLSMSLQTGIEQAENYLTEMQNRNFSPFEIIRSVPILGHMLGWLFSPAEESDLKDQAALLGQSFDLESKSLSRRLTQPSI